MSYLVRVQSGLSFKWSHRGKKLGLDQTQGGHQKDYLSNNSFGVAMWVG